MIYEELRKQRVREAVERAGGWDNLKVEPRILPTWAEETFRILSPDWDGTLRPIRQS